MKCDGLFFLSMTNAAFGDGQITCYVECSIIIVSTPLLVTKLLLSEARFIGSYHQYCLYHVSCCLWLV